MDGLQDEEKDSRSKYNYIYKKNGIREYPSRESHFRNQRKEHRKDCRWKYYRGTCVVHTIFDDWYHRDHVVVKFEFIPTMAKQLASDLNETYTVDFYNPTYDYVITRNIKIGNVYRCDKRKKLTGECPSHDYDFIELQDIDEKEAKKDE